MPRRKRIKFVVFGIAIALMFVLLASSHVRTRGAIIRTTVQVLDYKVATTNFFAMTGRWPTSATELVSNPLGIIFIYPSPPARDGWKRQLVYEPFDTNAGYGRVVSYGRDGKPGGSGADADIEVRFP